jgi:hypothetical protein
MLLKFCLNSGFTLKILVNSFGLEPVQIDYGKSKTLSRACNGVDKIFLLSPNSARAVELASKLVNEAKKAGVKPNRCPKINVPIVSAAITKNRFCRPLALMLLASSLAAVIMVLDHSINQPAPDVVDVEFGLGAALVVVVT